MPGGREVADGVLAEAAGVSAAAGFPVPAEQLATIRATVTEEGSPATSSAYRDLLRGDSVEVEQIFADLVTRARELGIPTPLLELATASLRVHQRRVATTRSTSPTPGS